MVGPPDGARPDRTALDPPDVSTHVCVALGWPGACHPPLGAPPGIAAGRADGARARGKHTASGAAPAHRTPDRWCAVVYRGGYQIRPGGPAVTGPERQARV